MGRWLVAAGMFLLWQLFPLAQCVWFERRLRPAIERAKQDYEIPEEAAVYLTVANDELKDSHKVELTRREQFNRKGQAYLMGVTLATSFAIGILGVHARAGSGQLPAAVKVLLLAVVASLVMSAWSALKVIAPSEAFDLYLQSRHTVSDEEKADLEKRQLVKLILLNQGII